VYNSFFSLRENPFNLTPDPRFLYLSTYHKEALDSLLLGINERRGMITITGDIGTGKTTLCRVLLSQLDDSVKSALIFNSFISDMELLESLNEEFGIDAGNHPKTLESRTMVLKEFLLQNVDQGGNAVLLIDEAQNLSYSVLQQILILSRLQKGEEKLLQIVLVGQPELKEGLASPALENFDESITLHHELKALKSKDIQGYVEHRLGVAGGKANVIFADGVFERIYANTWGNPRRINAVCDRALLIAYVEGEHTVTTKIIGQALEELRGDLPQRPIGEWSLAKLKPEFLLPLLFLLLVVFSVWTFREQILGIFSDDPKPRVTKIVKPLPPLSKNVMSEEPEMLLSPEQEQAYESKAMPSPSGLEPVADTPEPMTEESVLAEAPIAEKGSPRETPGYSIQVGAFRVEANARNLLTELFRKGYTPSIETIPDYRNNLWYSVRIRNNTTLEDAYRAASDYRAREEKNAILTKGNSLDPVPFFDKQGDNRQ
jgi:general secretion pathway protein A